MMWLLEINEINDATEGAWAKHDKLSDYEFWRWLYNAIAKAQLKSSELLYVMLEEDWQSLLKELEE